MSRNPARAGYVLLLASSLAVLVLLTVVYFTQRTEVVETGPWRAIPLPDVSHQPIELSVTQVINPRFPALSREQLQATLRRAEQLARQHLDVQIKLKTTEDMTIGAFFSLLPDQPRQARQNEIIDPMQVTAEQRRKMQQSLLESMRNGDTPTDQLLSYARPYLLTRQPVDNLTQLADAVIDTMLKRVRTWYEYPAADGRPVLDGSPYNQWVWWDSMGYADLPMQVVITNQLVASLENYDQALHTCLRGGISGGTMTYSRSSPNGGYLFVSVYALLNDNPALAPLKDGEYSPQQVVDYAAATLVHELGHLLFHYGHPFGAEGCIMAPTPLLRYQHWFDQLDAAACAAERYPQMRPGAARILYHSGW